MSNFLEKANITGTSLNFKKKKKEVFITYVYMKRDMFLFLIFKGSVTFKIHKTDGVSDISVCTLLLCPNKIVRLRASLF